MTELPLFPLHTVLFPGMPLRLHVFEPRYKQLVQYCLSNQSAFGVALIADGQEALGPLPSPHEIGCTAQISYLEPVGEGRSNLLAIGGERIRIERILQRDPYLVASVELLPHQNDDPDLSERWAVRTQPLFEKYISQLSQMGLWQQGSLEHPLEPILLANFAATVLQIPDAQKQDLLASGTIVEFFGNLDRTLRRETALLKALAERGWNRMESTSGLN
jgi:Lon protease-like protein